jgi:hypothetical protein
VEDCDLRVTFDEDSADEDASKQPNARNQTSLIVLDSKSRQHQHQHRKPQRGHGAAPAKELNHVVCSICLSSSKEQFGSCCFVVRTVVSCVDICFVGVRFSIVALSPRPSTNIPVLVEIIYTCLWALKR